MSKRKEQQPDISRRRILRGMAGAPVVMTLANGAQGAVASNLDCIVNNAPALEQQLTTAFGDPDANGRYCVASTQVMDTAPPITGIKNQGAGTPIRTDATGTEVNVGDDYTNKWCVEYVNESGGSVGYNSVSGSPVTASCYTSFV